MGSRDVRELTLSPAYRISSVVLIAVFFAGFINLFPSPGTAPATLVIDGLLAVMFAAVIARAAKEQGRIQIDSWMFAWLLLVAAYAVLALQGGAPIGEQLTTIRSHALYAFIAIFISIAVRSVRELDRLLLLVMRLGVAFSIFGVLQYVLRGQLPMWLLASSDTRLFSYFGTDITRSNGLMGNTIVYSATLLLFISLWAFKLAQRPNIHSAVATAVVFAAIITTFSRTAIVGAILILLIALLKLLGRNGIQKLIPALLGAAMLGAVIVLALFANPQTSRSISESFIVADLFGERNASVQGSTAGHDAFLDFALQSFAENPMTGLGIGSQSVATNTSVQITDGANLAVAVEGGFFLFVPWVLLIGSAAVAALRARRLIAPEYRFVAVGLVVFITYQFGVASFVNSAIIGKTPYLLFWGTFGILMALVRVGRTERALADERLPLRGVVPSGNS